MKKHLKRLAAPRSWAIGRKQGTFITRIAPGAHPHDLGMPLSVVLKDMINVAHTTKEVKKALQIKKVLVDNKRVKDHKRAVGLMDTISLNDVSYRMTLDEKGLIRIKKIDEKEANVKLTKIIGKTKISKNKTQLNCSDARNILVEKDTYRVGDSLVIELPSQKIKTHLKFETGSLIILTGGKHKGHQGKLIDITDNTMAYMSVFNPVSRPSYCDRYFKARNS